MAPVEIVISEDYNGKTPSLQCVPFLEIYESMLLHKDYLAKEQCKVFIVTQAGIQGNSNENFFFF